MPDESKATLLVEKGVRDTTEFTLHQPVYVLGNSPESDIVLDNPYASRRMLRSSARETNF